ncbi:class I SAM-dependent methyltransferase [Actinocrispum sp. NPDC049592]|uniref:class I SAM-dependent DNA methyltransferase n=1 Tax=Actinocrispum sp. NPDC049592 TaxID=3154835 RepID=UPI00342CE864
MNSVFEPLLAALSGPVDERFHRGKDYRAEADQLRDVFLKEGSVSSVLNLGCGTGRHLELLAAAGYDVVGVERSPELASRARVRLAGFPSRAAVVEADLFELTMDRTFDAVIMMFAMLGHQVTNHRVRSTLDALRRQVGHGGLVVFDVLDAAQVLASPPVNGVLSFTSGDREVLIAHTTVVNVAAQVIELCLRTWELPGGGPVEQTYTIRYFAQRELALVLQVAGLELVGSAPLAASRLVWARRI